MWEITSAPNAFAGYQQLARAKIVLENQIVRSLAKIPPAQLEGNIILAYEPVWAIGPGKTPPNSDYIGLITDFIKQTVNANFKTTPPVVYGGGLKAENAAMLADIYQLDGGLIALTNFIHPIGFQVDELGKILSIYTS
ncbi:triose-phosphate isomerase [Photobacterium gaetbulicola]|uniref:triose-phosphate isomerase n=1 Tax=Photobacterium gaetbulicola TaxID=1295392 RepID=UPI0009DC9FF6